MPYIKQERREDIDLGGSPQFVGELTYKLFKTCIDYLPPKPNFIDYSEVIAALECAKLEFYRTRVALHEDSKRFENGDVK